MAAPVALLFAATSASMDLMGGLFANWAAKEAAGIAESRGRMLRMEADNDAQRYAEQARGFSAKQRLAYLKSGVHLSGSPLDVLDRDMLTASENVEAIRMRGAVGQLEQNNIAGQARNGGRAALMAGISSGIGKIGMAAYQGAKTDASAAPTNNTTGYTAGRTNYGGHV